MGDTKLRTKNIKGQQIISAILIVLITIALIGVAYSWGLPLIRKRQDAAKVDRLANYFSSDFPNSLMKKIVNVANNGGEETFFIDMNGLWVLHEYDEVDPVMNNSIEFNTFSRESNIGLGIGWVSLTGDSCPPEKGFPGVNEPWAVCARADPTGEGFNIKYAVWLRELEESSEKGYKIRLIKHEVGPSSSTGKRMRISRERVYTCTPAMEPLYCDKTLIITEIKILLE